MMKTFGLATVGIKADKTPDKENLTPESGVATENKVEEQSRKTGETFLSDMDAIARGVGARYELITGRSKRITEETIAIARKLGIPGDEIKRWASSRLIHDIKRVMVIESFLERGKGLPRIPAQRGSREMT